MAIGSRLKDEMKRYAAIAAYLYVCFIAVLLYKAAILRDVGVEFAPFGFAAVKALVLAKIMLVGEAMHVGARMRLGSLLHVVLFRSTLFLVLIAAFSALEKIIHGLVHHESLGADFVDFAGGTLPEILATSLLIFLVLLPYFAYRQVDEALGKGTLVRILRTRQAGAERPAGWSSG